MPRWNGPRAIRLRLSHRVKCVPWRDHILQWERQSRPEDRLQAIPGLSNNNKQVFMNTVDTFLPAIEHPRGLLMRLAYYFIQLHQRLRERGIAIEILINNAGHGLQGPFLDGQLDTALAMVQLDIASLTAITYVFAQDMRKRRRGKILLVASLLAYQGVENFAVYSAAKAYVLRLGEALHRELKGDG